MDVKYMSKEKNLSDHDYWQRFATVNSWRAVVCKLADRLHNLRTLEDVTPEKRKRKIQETKDKVLPLFDVAKSLTPRRYQRSIETLCKEIEVKL
jgi:(p)ppGpp synthase/HD superfamily hydrolase